ncbi:MAG: polysaccharide biosynthesis protein [Clostridiales bacterium]|nr:polysaccharide biosynthesis protein [Clostridiales bacterium]
MSNKQKQNTFFGGAAILAVGIVLVKIISAVYKMPLINILGSGYTDFSNAFNVFNILLMISTAGIPVAISKMISEANAQGHQNQVHKIFRVSLLFFMAFGAVCSLAMFFWADTFAELLGNPKSALSMRVLAPSVFLVSGIAAFRGYAQGHSHMTPSSVSQIIEALFKLIVGLSLAMFLINSGSDESTAAAGAIVGVTVSELAALCYLAVEYLHTRRLEPAVSNDTPWDSKRILKTCLTLAIPITLTSSATSILTTIDTSLIQNQLQNAVGLTLDETRSLYSQYSGVLTVYQIPSALMAALTASAVPAITVYLGQKNRRGVSRVVGSSLKTAAMVAFPCGVGMIVLGTPIVKLLFPSLTADIAGPILSILGVASIAVCLMLVCNAILQAHDILYIPIVTMVIGGVIMVLFDYFVVAIPEINIFGSPIGSSIGYGITCLLDLIVLSRVVPHCPNFLGLFAKPLIASVVMGAGAWACYGLLYRLTSSNTISLLMAILVAVVIYVALLLLLKTITKDDLALMPKGETIGRLLRIK